jgi:hypothetical protein
MQQKRANFNAYINAKDFDPIPAVSGVSAVAIALAWQQFKRLFRQFF